MIWLVLGILFLIALIFAYSICKAGGNADDLWERLIQAEANTQEGMDRNGCIKEDTF